MSAGNDSYLQYHDLPATSQQPLNVDALATTATTTTPPVWLQNSTHHPSQHPSHALYVASEPAHLFHYASTGPEAILPSWPSNYGQSELHQWDPYAHQSQAGNPSHVLPMIPQQTAFSSAEPSHELSAIWHTHQQYPPHTANPVVTAALSTRQNSPYASSWPGVNPGHSSDANLVFESSSKINQPWQPAHSHSDQEEYMRHTSMDGLKSPPGQLRGHQKLPSQKKSAKVPSSFVGRQEKVKVSKRKGPLQDKQRERTHAMRKSKRICVRCRFYKSGCDEGDPCEKCNKVTGHARSFREPCYREHLEDTSLVRRCNGREHQGEAGFLTYDWIYNSQLYEMDILWNLPKHGPISGAQPLRITYRPYTPLRGHRDIVTSVWTNIEGKIQQPVQPAFAIYDTANLVPAFDKYFSSLQPGIEEWIFARTHQDEIAFLTYQEAVRMRDETGSKALTLAMRLQGLSVVSQGYGTVWSENTPGIHEYDYRALGTSHYEAYDRNSCDRPLPGAITHQMDVAAVKCMAKLEKAFVKELAALIFKPKIKPWYELFLTFFVIFWNMEYIRRGAQDYIMSKKGTPVESQVSNVVITQVKKWEFAFPVLLYHWRCILRGYSPFKIARDSPEELRERGHIDHNGFEYAVKISGLFKKSKLDQFQPPLTGFPATHWSMASTWISSLFKEAGA